MLDQITNYLLNAPITDVSHFDSDITFTIGAHRLWVSTPWRLEKDGKIIIGHENLVDRLEHEDYRGDYEALLVFLQERLKGNSINEVHFSDFNELTLKFSNGYIFRSFQTYGDYEDDGDEAENFQLYVGNERFLVYDGKVEQEELGTFYKGAKTWPTSKKSP